MRQMLPRVGLTTAWDVISVAAGHYPMACVGRVLMSDHVETSGAGGGKTVNLDSYRVVTFEIRITLAQ